MEKIILFASDQWLLVSLLAAAVWALFWLDLKQAGNRISANQLTSMVNRQSAVVVDLREKAEYDVGHIVDAANVPFGQWQLQKGEAADQLFKAYFNKPLILVCKMGQQSSQVAKKIDQSKFNGVYRLAGGIAEWQAAQLPLVKS